MRPALCLAQEDVCAPLPPPARHAARLGAG